MAADQIQDLSVAKLVAGVVGSVASLRFVQGSLIERLSMAVGGASLSYYAATPVAVWAGSKDAEGLAGFLIGLFGMAIVAKLYEMILVMDAKQLASDAWEAFLRKWRA